MQQIFPHQRRMHLSLQLNANNATIFFSILEAIQQDVWIVFNNTKDTFQILFRDQLLFSFKLDTIFNEANVESSGPFAIQFSVARLAQHHKLLKKNDCSLRLAENSEKKPELLLTHYGDSGRLTEDNVQARVHLPVTMRKGSQFNAIKEYLDLSKDQIDKFEKQENVKLTLPKQCFLQYVPVDDENDL